MAKKRAHWLISIPCAGGYMHGYLVTVDQRVVMTASEKLIQAVEELTKHERTMMLPIILQTPLGATIDDDIRWLRAMLCTRFPDTDVAAHLSTSQDFHFTAWWMDANEPDNRKLMEWH